MSSLSMSQASLPVFVRALTNLSNILKKAEAHAKAEGLDQGVLIGARLAPDMHPLARQVQIASDATKGAAARLSGTENPSFPDNEATFEELQERLAKTIAFIRSVPAGKVDGSEEKEIHLKVGGRDLNFKGRDYLLGFALPNLFFHISIAHGILRHNGVDIGKMDYLGTPQ
ncbi:MAG TPA: DUF1993 domain-containing protein [Alphaproteobacteria bacterium]|nr:DUF1993 domain-containing protein [Alphaproteobacteria bacterium]